MYIQSISLVQKKLNIVQRNVIIQVPKKIN